MINNSAIFRREALEHRAHHWLGSPQVIIPVSASVWAMLALVLIASLIAFLVLGTYTQKARLAGSVVHHPAVARIIAPRDGIIVSSLAEEGKTVRAGEVIYVVNMETQTEFGGTRHETAAALKLQKATIEREIKLKSEAADIEQNFLLLSLENKEVEQQKMDDLIGKSTQQTSWLLEKVQHFKELVRQGIALETEHMSRRSEYYSAAVQLENYKREKVRLQGEIVNIKAQLAAIHSEIEVSLEILHRQTARLDQDLISIEEQRELQITSPIDGTLTGITGLAGNTIRAAQELASVVPTSGQVEVEIFATADTIGELREGQAVRLRFDAYPYQWFGQYDGIVRSISTTSVEQRLDISEKQAHQPQRHYFQVRIIPKNNAVVMAGETYPLRPGIGVQTDVFIRKRPLYEWLLLPLKAARDTAQSHSGEVV
ncbi:HlyD family efflux transporter periplasmic adaptor subunit [Yersinia enterocolitica]|uniref:Putative microcin H47 secretion ATP-binding protein mchF n=2 Tax=Yersinia enterocolitica TaxID=630 RepID=A0A0H5G2E2_YEREN|nr:HlyD family efflux transporter periplasmic adaptor subunit [Yersinia enterocolitica]EKN3330088.1 HlyD family efflux transporter periplasmic adaptor subunit [Yersinia enterocolitica]EKN3496001.1 HlyD family efflux transporter periplasmic adaptor subunit [Yersinia enterocolitica]EKN3508856.1 HlyD family efflux transporter periplasmic adaptor subunit [Yersinia enterocolitica]EKN3556958.1 HlyD family efflux transporter periplasmic adaptor subunit [Yersinia enterocolitica]EKN3692489.1 HlyD famil